jgi:hypothetical protein
MLPLIIGVKPMERKEKIMLTVVVIAVVFCIAMAVFSHAGDETMKWNGIIQRWECPNDLGGLEGPAFR